jgi:HK97 family phage prohead protease
MWDFFGPYNEIIDRSAFDETLTADPDVSFLVNHRGVTMARRKPGTKDGDQTLLLDMADTGLRSHAWVNPARTDVSDLVHAINDGDITEMSFAFMLDEGWWSDDFETFKITKVDLHRGDVSAVNYGANPYTSIAARSREILADLDGLPVGAARAALARLNLRTDLDLPQSNGRSRTTRTPAPPPAPLTAPAQEPEQSTGRSLTQIDAWLATLGQ